MPKSINFIKPVSDKVEFLGERIKNDHAKQMIQLFKANYSGSPFVSFAVKFDSADVKEFNALMRETGADGFSIYFAMYPLSGVLNPGGKQYNGRHTIVIIPSKAGVPVIDPYQPVINPGPVGGSDAYNHGQLEP
jgi:hypothetical protein